MRYEGGDKPPLYNTPMEDLSLNSPHYFRRRGAPDLTDKHLLNDQFSNSSKLGPASFSDPDGTQRLLRKSLRIAWYISISYLILIKSRTI